MKNKEKNDMKKTYKIPTLTVVKIQAANLLQAISGEFGEGTKSGFDAATRESYFSDWEDETIE